MKATHRFTYLPSGGVYLTHVHGDNYYIVDSPDKCLGPFKGFRANFVDNDKWLVEKVNTFKGNR